MKTEKIIMSAKLTFARFKQIRWYSTKEKMKVVYSVNEQFLNNELKHRKHPGIINHGQPKQPSWLLKTVQIILADGGIPANQIHESGKKLALHLKGRHPPMEKRDCILKLNEARLRSGKTNIMNDTEEDDIILNDIHMPEDLQKDKQVRKHYKQLAYNWKPIDYTKFTSLSYLVSRSVPEYSVLYRIFNEIKTKDTDFIPRTLLDFGSGIGTVLWAASQFWFKSIKEYYCIDASTSMNELSECILKRAVPQIPLNYVFYKQFLPVSPTPTYDIVVSAYSLFELPNQNARLDVLTKLWYKTEHYLIIVEQGTNAGFNLVIEARDFILNYTKNKSAVHVVSPCPHDLKCPRYLTDNTPCNFEVIYQTLRILQKSTFEKEHYSYVVMKKGERPKDDPQWPRIVRPVLLRSKHVICRMCTASGELQEQIFTKWKNGRNTYRCARCSKWGDCLPFEIEKVENTEESE